MEKVRVKFIYEEGDSLVVEVNSTAGEVLKSIEEQSKDKNYVVLTKASNQMPILIVTNGLRFVEFDKVVNYFDTVNDYEHWLQNPKGGHNIE